MKGLLLKDWYEIRYQYRWFLILLAVAGFSSATGQGNAVFWGCYMMILVAMIPLNTMGYDEKSGWQKYSRCFPVSSGHLVLEKYLLGVIALIVAGGVYLLFSAIFYFIPGVGNAKEQFFTILAAMITVGVFPMALMLPLNIRFGMEKARVYLIFFIIIVAVAAGGIFAGAEDLPMIVNFLAGINLDLFILLLPLISIALLAATYPLSVWLYHKKEW